MAQKTSIRQYGEPYTAEIDEEKGRLVVIATNEGGYNATTTDLQDILDWAALHRRDMIDEAIRNAEARHESIHPAQRFPSVPIKKLTGDT